MKKKTDVVVYFLIFVVIAMVISGLVIFSKRDLGKKEKLDLQANEIANIEESSKEIPDFKIDIVGDYEGEINGDLLKEKEVKIYEFDAGIDRGKTVETSKYVGIKLADLLEAIDVYEYSSLEFSNSEPYASVIKEVNDKSFIVFMKNDKSTDISLLLVDKPYTKSVENVVKLFITNDYSTVDENGNPIDNPVPSEGETN